MPHTRAARLAALGENSDSDNELQMLQTGTNVNWDDYAYWNMEGSPYQLETSACLSSDGAIIDQFSFLHDVQSSTTYATHASINVKSREVSNPEFNGVQAWYTSISPTVITQSQLSGSDFTSYESTPSREDKHLADQKSLEQPKASTSAYQPFSSSHRGHLRRPSDASPIDLIEILDDAPGLPSRDEHEQVSSTVVNDRTRRKTHSVIEKHYRSRLHDGMTELRHCVPSTTKEDDATPHRSSAKTTTLSDAVQYVKSLEGQNTRLRGQLDVMQKRNNTLQIIARSKGETTLGEEIDINTAEERREELEDVQTRKRSKKSPIYPSRYSSADSIGSNSRGR